MAVIKSGESSDNMSVDATSKAARVTLYDTRGNSLADVPTYRAGTNPTVTTAATNTTPIFVLYGSPTKTIRIQKVVFSGPTTATLAIQGVSLIKYSSQPTGGTATALTQVAMDSTSAAGSAALCQVYTVVPTSGTAVGVVGSMRALNKSTTAVDGSELRTIEFHFGESHRTEDLVLRGTAQGIGLQLHVATATTAAIMVEWTEE